MDQGATIADQPAELWVQLLLSGGPIESEGLQRDPSHRVKGHRDIPGPQRDPRGPERPQSQRRLHPPSTPSEEDVQNDI